VQAHLLPVAAGRCASGKAFVLRWNRVVVVHCHHSREGRIAVRRASLCAWARAVLLSGSAGVKYQHCCTTCDSGKAGVVVCLAAGWGLSCCHASMQPAPRRLPPLTAGIRWGRQSMALCCSVSH
jgi:hypothetical protein